MRRVTKREQATLKWVVPLEENLFILFIPRIGILIMLGRPKLKGKLLNLLNMLFKRTFLLFPQKWLAGIIVHTPIPATHKYSNGYRREVKREPYPSVFS